MHKSNYAVWTCPRCGHQIEPHQGGNLFEEGRQHMHDHLTEDYAMIPTHETVGDFYAIAPEIISTTPTPQPDTILNWAGENFTVQGGPVLDRVEAAYAVEAIESMLGQTYDRTRLRALGALAHKLDPNFPAPDNEDDE